jgi:hypothetical protein
MKRFVEGTDRKQITLFPECLEDWVDENNSVQVIDVFVDELDLAELGFDGVAPEVTNDGDYRRACQCPCRRLNFQSQLGANWGVVDWTLALGHHENSRRAFDLGRTGVEG